MAVVLVVDDDLELLDVFCRILESGGAHRPARPGGLDAKDNVLSLHYDLLLTDIAMRFIDGWELIRLARQRNASVPIIAISGGSLILPPDTALRLASALGVNLTMAKPIRRQELIAAVNRVLVAPST
jgi:CheY-like chemotaxis protein